MLLLVSFLQFYFWVKIFVLILKAQYFICIYFLKSLVLLKQDNVNFIFILTFKTSLFLIFSF